MLEWACREAESQATKQTLGAARVRKWLGRQPLVFLSSDSVAGKFRRSSYDSLSYSEVILLPPIDAGALVPVVGFKYDWKRSFPELRLRVGIYLENEQDE